MSDAKLYMGIEVLDASLKVAVLDSAENRVTKVAVLPTEASPLDNVYAFESALQNWMDENQISVNAVSVCVSAFRSIVRQIYVPAEAANDMKDYINWYVSLITGIPANSYIIDYKILRGDPSLGFTVMLIALREHWVDNLRKGFRSKALIPHALDVDVIALMNLVNYAEKLTELTCVLKADYAGVTLLWLFKDDLRALRCVSTLSLANKSKEEAYVILVDKIANQIELAHTEDSSIETKEIRICGDMANDSDFVNRLSQKLPDCHILPMDSFSNLRLPTDESEANIVTSCAGAIGAALNVMEGV